MLMITSKTTSPNSDELIIPGIKTHDHYSINISEPRILSPRYSVVTGGGGGIGLGIVAALDKFGGGANNGSNANSIAIGVEVSTATGVRSMYCNIEDERNHILKKWRQLYESPSPIFYNTSAVNRDYPPSDFLSSCYLCREKLHGKDIYMYRGEKAFCSPECRNQQIAADEREDKKRLRRRNGVSRSSFDVSSSAGASPYLEDHLFSPGIMAI